MVSLRPINESNREAVEALRVSSDQEQFVSSVADSTQLGVTKVLDDRLREVPLARDVAMMMPSRAETLRLSSSGHS